jgi:hypothetical protein
MTTAMNDPDVINFMTLFCELCRWMKDDPSKLRIMVANDDTLAKLCNDLQFAGLVVRLDKRHSRKRFPGSVSNEFVTAWLEYEECWEPLVLDAVSDYIFGGIELADAYGTNAREEFARRWELADEEARNTIAGFEMAMERATDSLKVGNFPEDYAEAIEDSVVEFRLLPERVGKDLRGILRRRRLVPMVLIPAHLTEHHEKIWEPQPNNRISLLLHLQQTQEAFILGVPLTTVSHMCALTELVLSSHYGFFSGNLQDKIDRLPPNKTEKDASHKLRMLANDVLHFGTRPEETRDESEETEFERRRRLHRRARLDAFAMYAASLFESEPRGIKDAIIHTERELISYLYALRDLIENAPNTA